MVPVFFSKYLEFSVMQLPKNSAAAVSFANNLLLFTHVDVRTVIEMMWYEVIHQIALFHFQALHLSLYETHTVHTCQLLEVAWKPEGFIIYSAELEPVAFPVQTLTLRLAV